MKPIELLTVLDHIAFYDLILSVWLLNNKCKFHCLCCFAISQLLASDTMLDCSNRHSADEACKDLLHVYTHIKTVYNLLNYTADNVTAKCQITFNYSFIRGYRLRRAHRQNYIIIGDGSLTIFFTLFFIVFYENIVQVVCVNNEWIHATSVPVTCRPNRNRAAQPSNSWLFLYYFRHCVETAIQQHQNKWMKEWKCNDLKCVRKPTKSRLSLTHHANKSSRWAE